jgi:predicted Rossmann fold flavoprotein
VKPQSFDVVIVGSGAAGMMCAIEAGKRGSSALVLDHAAAPGEKIRISGGGRCNFPNLETKAERLISGNPHFAKSALARYSAHDFVALVERHGIAYHEKTLGQLFCDGSAREIIAMLLAEMEAAGAHLRLKTAVKAVEKTEDGFRLILDDGVLTCASLVIATGGKSIPKMGATGFAYDVARQFGLAVTETRPALVPLTIEAGALAELSPLAGVSVDAVVACGKTRFAEAMLFTHRGLSGPAILQISSYWREGDELNIDMALGVDVAAELKQAKGAAGRQSLATALSAWLPKRLAQKIAGDTDRNLADTPDKVLMTAAEAVNRWRIKPVGSEGYRTAEVTLGGIDTAGLDQKTMAARAVSGLYFIGEAVDVTGWLGGYNFQWAWSSGWVAGQAV